MKPLVLITCCAAALLGVGAGFLVVHGWLPWEIALGALGIGLAYATFRVREDLRHAVSAKAQRFRRRPAATG